MEKAEAVRRVIGARQPIPQGPSTAHTQSRSSNLTIRKEYQASLIRYSRNLKNYATRQR